MFPFEQLRTQGWCILSDFLNPSEIKNMKEWADTLKLTQANIKNDLKSSINYRGDFTFWLDEDSDVDVEKSFLSKLDSLKNQLNEAFFLGLKSFESHLAYYPPKAKYGKHIDSFKEGNKRVISLVTYLNTEWKNEDGGCLRLHLDNEIIDIPPDSTTTILFLSKEIEHEVLETMKDRWSIACWFKH